MIEKQDTERKEYLRVKDIAAKLDVSKVTVQRWASQGELPGAFQIGTTWFIPTDAIDKRQREALKKTRELVRRQQEAARRDKQNGNHHRRYF